MGGAGMKMMTARLRRGLGFTMFFGRGERFRTADYYLPKELLATAIKIILAKIT
jgi:hypothetical protein